MGSKEFDDRLVRFFSQHLVALNVYCTNPDGVRLADAYSCSCLRSVAPASWSWPATP